MLWLVKIHLFSATETRQEKEGFVEPLAAMTSEAANTALHEPSSVHTKTAMTGMNKSSLSIRKIVLPSAPIVEEREDIHQANEQKLQKKDQLAVPAELAPRNEYATAKHSIANTQETRDVLSALNSLDGYSLQFYFPQNRGKRRDIVQHMYRCEGVLFGVVDRATKSELIILSPQTSEQMVKSEFLRVVNYDLSQREQQLLNLYAANEIPVRVFPYSLDYRLASLIANELGNHESSAKLSQLSGKYILSEKGLGLSNIKLNGQFLDKSWLLSNKVCLS